MLLELAMFDISEWFLIVAELIVSRTASITSGVLDVFSRFENGFIVTVPDSLNI